jgi:hypothetical protein
MLAFPIEFLTVCLSQWLAGWLADGGWQGWRWMAGGTAGWQGWLMVAGKAAVLCCCAAVRVWQISNSKNLAGIWQISNQLAGFPGIWEEF